MNAEEVLNDLADVLMMLRRQESVVLATIAELDRDGYSVPFGSAAKMVADVGRVGLAESRRLAERALALHGTVGLSGAPIPPTLPNAAAAYADGEISGEHIDRIRGLTEELPAEVLAGESWPVAEECLVAIARDVGPRGLTRPIRELHARLDPDGQEPRENEPAEPRRELRLRQRRNRFDIDGYLDIETGLQLQALLDALGKPRSAADARTAPQRHGDAFAEVIQLAAGSKDLPESGGEPFTILLTAAETALETGIGTAAAMDGTRIPAAQIQRIACDSTLITEDGHRKRAPSAAQRRALIARDRGCAHPDCDRPPSLAQAHHIQHYANDGPTTLDNLVLLCGWHHRLLHHAGWAVRMEDGLPCFTPPGYRRIAA